jgi:hypothetical protein
MYLQTNNQVLVNMWFFRELGSTNPRLFSPSENEVNNTTLGTGANLQQRSSAADACIMGLLN